tara:strand:+ start:2218 stop:2706 length:489 start_codon:yes stop_codon:yes gene_type:complete
MKSSNNKLSKKEADSNNMVLMVICALTTFLLFRVLFIKEEGFQDLSNNEKSDADIVNELDSVCSILETQDQIKFEKNKLERNKSYALKLKQQQDEIIKLEQIIKSMKAHTKERMKRADVINMIKAENMNIDANKLKMNLDKRLRNQELHNIDAQINLEPRIN